MCKAQIVIEASIFLVHIAITWKTFLRALDYYLQSVNTLNYNLSKPLRNLHIFTHFFISLTAYLSVSVSVSERSVSTVTQGLFPALARRRTLEKHTDFFLKSRDMLGLSRFWPHSFSSFSVKKDLNLKQGIVQIFITICRKQIQK